MKDRSALSQQTLFAPRPPELRVTFEDLFPGEDLADNFAGAGGGSTGTVQAAGKPMAMALNHDPEAIAIHQANHRETRHYCEDITEVDPREVCRGRKIGLAWFAPDCFPAGTLVLTIYGQMPIETVPVGMEVLTHKGRWRRVKSTTSKDAATVELRGYGHYGLVTTANHPFYSKRITKRYPSRKDAAGKRPSMQRELVENPYWPKAEDMKGKLWATPRSYPAAAIPTCSGAEFSDDFFYFVGRWLGDGSLNKGDVEICCGTSELEELSQRMRAHPLRRADGPEVPFRFVNHGASHLLVWGNAALGRWLEQNFGVGCEGKSLPVWCLSMQARWRQALLAGYVDADGHRGVRTDTDSVSKPLSIGIRLLAVSLGHAAALYFAPGRPGEIEGRSFMGRDMYRVGWREELQRETVHWDRLHMFSPVREVKTTGRTERVYCLEVEEDESYVADGIVVHNCTHHSKAKGGKPRDNKSRGLAQVVVDWARLVKPRIIMVENVEEFEDWGPLDDTGRPDKAQLGEYFRPWVAALQDAGYRVEWRLLVGADFGAPTTRKRFFLVARRDGKPIVWPVPTHGAGRARPWRAAAEIIEWDRPTISIFGRKRPLADATLRRIGLGIERYVVNCAEPFIIPVTHPRDARVHSLRDPLRTVTAAKRGEFALVSPFIVRHGHYSKKTGAGLVPGKGMPGVFRGQSLEKALGTVTTRDDKNLVVPILTKHYGGSTGHQTPGSAADRPLGTVTARDHHSVSAVELEPIEASFVTKFYGTNIGSDVRSPLPTVTATGNHLGEVRAFMIKYYGAGGRFQGQGLKEPVHSITTHARFGLVMVHGEPYQIVDIGMRMLSPRELFRAQDFPDDYIIDPEFNGKTLSKEAQTRGAGNAINPCIARALVHANARAA